MDGIGRKAGWWLVVFPAIAILLTGVVLRLVQVDARSPQSPASDAAAHFGPGNMKSAAADPIEVYRRYLNAVKTNDLAEAKSCWRITGNNSADALDRVVGIWIDLHRFNAAVGKLDDAAQQFSRADCTDAAIDRTLARLDQSKVDVTNETAKLTIKWAENDGYPDPAFFYSDEPICFRKTESGWKIDGGEMSDGDARALQDAYVIESGGHFMFSQEMIDEIVAGVESGKIKTATDVVHRAEKYFGSLDGLIPFTMTTIYEENTPARYLRIKKGNPGIFSRGSVPTPPARKDADKLISIEGDLNLVFREMYGHPKIVVETQNTKGYEITYNPDDPKALEIVARQLGMAVSEEEREILALRITVGKSGHHLKQAAKPSMPQWDSSVSDDDVYPLHGITLDELALFLERCFRCPVVNVTGLAGYYWLDVSAKSVRLWPQKIDEVQPLDETGLELHWEPTKVRVLVVKDASRTLARSVPDAVATRPSALLDVAVERTSSDHWLHVLGP